MSDAGVVDWFTTPHLWLDGLGLLGLGFWWIEREGQR